MKQINKIPKINTREIGPHNSCWEKNHVEIYHCYPLETFCSHLGWGARDLAKTHENPMAGTSVYTPDKYIIWIFF